MPEYLAPAVYVEEVDTGSKPIEGVSTSTTGVVGVAERGPVNVPILVTSFGEYQWWFGGMLRADLYTNTGNPGNPDRLCYLPHAVEGFFLNGGKRLFVVRALDPGAAVAAERQLVAPDPAAPPATALLRGAPTGAAALIVANAGGLNPGDTIQIGDGVGAEYRTIAGAPAPASVVPVDLALAFDHPAALANGVEQIPALADAGAADTYASTLSAEGPRGATAITVANAAPAGNPLAAGDLLRIGAAGQDEYVFLAGPPAGTVLQLRAPLQLTHPANGAVVRQTAPGAPVAQTQLTTASAPGDAVVEVQNTAGFTTAGDFLRFLHPTAARIEIRRVGALRRVPLQPEAYTGYPAGGAVQRVGFTAFGATFDLTADAAVGTTVVQVSNRVGIQPGGVLQIGVAPELELVEVAGVPAPLPNPNPGNVVLRGGLRRAHAAALNVVQYSPGVNAVTASTVAAADTAVNGPDLVVARGDALAANDVLRVTPAGGPPFYHTIGAPVPLAPQQIPLNLPLARAQAASTAVVVRVPIAVVRALDAGIWGNRLRVAMEPQEPPQAEPLLRTRVRTVVSNTSLRLRSAAGVESGTELIVTDATNTETRVKVQAVDRQNDYLLVLEPTTPLPGAVAPGDAVRSREHRVMLELLRQPDPANPARNEQAIDREVFANLSLDPRHSRYFMRVIGATWNMANPATTDDDLAPPRPLRRGDRRSEGDSNYVRILDLAPGPGLRAAPVATYETRADGTRRLILLPLANGDDAINTIGDPTYIGADSNEPELRTGLFALRNIEEISIVGAPGRTAVTMQAAHINHCELMRYRFAVLDGTPPPQDTLTNIQIQRQQFDTKYAALYHPWLLINDPYPLVTGAVSDYPIPPAGHVLGIYARTDIERGVHKAPANEVVRGVTGLQRLLNKEQHDLLNPYPVNINVIRDFRPNNRGIRVYGGRVITSDSDWKYVNVRRLLIFIEASIDRGLQWVVFEPNEEPLWARVRRSISNFLTLVWRNGALEGTKVEEAYFVKCDRTTMTQTDIDQGRLICLVGVAPVKPAEFVIVRIGLWTAHAED
jgi:uncharacterized protein